MAGSRLAPPRAPSGSVTLQSPPELAAADDTSSILTSLLPMLGTVGAIAMVTISNAGPTGFLTGGMFLLSSLGFVAANGWRQRAQRAAQVLDARREYLAYLTELRETVRTGARQQRRAAHWAYPAPSTLVFIAEERTRVWERGASDPDFLDVRLGVRDQPAALELEAPELPPLAQLDPLAASAAHRFLITHESVPDLPFGARLDTWARLEVTGPEQDARALARGVVIGAATLHHPEDLVVAVVADDASRAAWEWVKWLPHAQSRRAQDGAGPVRMVVGSFAELDDLLPEGLAQRQRFVPGGSGAPHVLVVVDGVPLQTATGAVRAKVQGLTVLDLPARWGEITEDAVARVALTRTGERLSAELVQLRGAGRAFTPDACTEAEAEAAARRLMPLYSGPAAVEVRGPQQSELVDLLGLPGVHEMDLDVAWRGRAERDRLRVPIGQDTSGAPLVLDLKESAQQGMGPHGVLIGATGSGKSEVLRTLVLALALTHSPEELNFVLVDFKGGATFAGMAGMPHVSAIITNLSDELSLVDRFQDALTGEMTRRQELLRSAGNFANVGDYEQARRRGRPDLEPLPALVVVVDEFSELLTAKPEFVDSFVAIGRVGRSLHVHLLIASQRLEEGRLRGLDTYLSYRIGLRTFSGAESRAVLGVPDAVDLPREPGVGYLKVGQEGMTQFRAAYVSGRPPRRVAGRRQVEQVGLHEVTAFTAARVAAPAAPVAPSPADPQRPAAVQADDERTTFDVAVDRMTGRGPQAHKVWLPPLEVPEPLDALLGDLAPDPALGLVSARWRATGALTVPVGVADVPLEQRREPLVVSLTGSAGHMAVVGRPVSGKSTLLRSTVASLSLTRTPLEVQFYVLDFGGGTFVGMRDLPHVSGVATRTEAEAVRRVVAEVSGVVDRREAYFREHGIDSIETYRARRAAGTVDDGWGDVFLVVDGWGTLRQEFEALEPVVQGIAARGLSFGVHLVVSATRWMEIRPQVKDLIGTRLELRLGDAGDSEVERKAAANVPATMPGRGLSPTKLHVLGALPRVDGSGEAATLADGVADMVARVRAAWRGPQGPRLRLLPTRVGLDEVRAAAGDERRLLLGVDEDALAPFGQDVLDEPHLYVFGESDSGKTSMLRAYAAEIQRLYTPQQAKIFVVDYRRGLLGEIPDAYLGAYLSSAEMATGGVQELAAFFRSRMPGPDVTAEQLRSRSWWSGAEGFVLVDDYDLVATSQGNPMLPLVPLLAQAADLGLHVVVARHTGGASRAVYDPVLQRLTDLGTTGMLLSGNPDEGAIIGRVKPQQGPAGRVQVVSRDRGLFRGHLAFVPSRHDAPGQP